ncbi:MAG: NUDIX hydrolase [Magnetococcales bacterium]|nr:NUDIX hydrolase [Magnetococcales bacterium]
MSERDGLSQRMRATVSAHGLILDRSGDDGVRILLVRLAYRDHREGKWSFPGGFVDVGESSEVAFKREVAEEIGLELLACRKVETDEMLLSEFPNMGVIYLCDTWRGVPECRSREIRETAWVNESDFLALERAGQLAYAQMGDQIRWVGWRIARPSPEGVTP